MAGHTAGIIDGTGNAGGADFLLMKFDSSGAHQWTRTRGGSSSNEYAKALQARCTERVAVLIDTRNN